jgi:hypothetical protein
VSSNGAKPTSSRMRRSLRSSVSLVLPTELSASPRYRVSTRSGAVKYRTRARPRRRRTRIVGGWSVRVRSWFNEPERKQSADDGLQRIDAREASAVWLDVDVADEHVDCPSRLVGGADPADAALTPPAVQHAVSVCRELRRKCQRSRDIAIKVRDQLPADRSAVLAPAVVLGDAEGQGQKRVRRRRPRPRILNGQGKRTLPLTQRPPVADPAAVVESVAVPQSGQSPDTMHSIAAVGARSCRIECVQRSTIY